MAIVNVTPKQSVTAWQITGDANIWTVFSSLAGAGYTCTVQCAPASGGPVYTVLVALPNYPTQQGHVGDWIVFDGKAATILTTAQFQAQYQ